jgi:hypothetical protein
LEHRCCSRPHSTRNRSGFSRHAFQKPMFGLAVRVTAPYPSVARRRSGRGGSRPTQGLLQKPLHFTIR